jgi:hypothetical protein
MRLATALRTRFGRGRQGGARAAAPSLESAGPLASAVSLPVAAALPLHPAPGWTALRLSVAEALWGEGFILPGGAAELLRLALPLGLTAASSLLLVGVGSGGPALRLTGDLGTWVSGYEADPMLASVAAQRVQRAGAVMAKRASIESWDPAAPDFRRRAFHHALVLDALRGPRIEDGLAAVAKALRSGGQIAVIQLVAGTSYDSAGPGLLAWQRMEGREGKLSDPTIVTRVLERLGFEVRVAEDISARYLQTVLAGWRGLLPQLDAEPPEPVRAAAVVTEAERWLRCCRLIREGQLRMMRWLAVDRAR